MPEVVYESPLVGISRLGQRVLNVDGQDCALSEVSFVEMLNLRGNAADARFLSAVADSTGMPLPTQPNTYHQSAQRQCLWLGPDEWLIKLRDGQGSTVAHTLRHALAQHHAAVVTVGDGYTTLTVQGMGASALLSRGCPLDLHPKAFRTGMVAQTHIAKSNAIVLCRETGLRYEITVRRSFADYLFSWLCEAGT